MLFLMKLANAEVLASAQSRLFAQVPLLQLDR